MKFNLNHLNHTRYVVCEMITWFFLAILHRSTSHRVVKCNHSIKVILKKIPDVVECDHVKNDNSSTLSVDVSLPTSESTDWQINLFLLRHLSITRRRICAEITNLRNISQWTLLFFFVYRSRCFRTNWMSFVIFATTKSWELFLSFLHAIRMSELLLL